MTYVPQRHLTLLIGPPGAGKSTAMRQALSPYERHELPNDGLVPRDALFHNGTLVGVELGKQRGEFSGSDALSQSILPNALKYLANPPEQPPAILIEGTRLANKRFLSSAVDLGYKVTLLHLDHPNLSLIHI